ncbi:outer membrane protein assembly factor BamA [Geobacter argillaceus]|uniref:Outer membrane protein assembly factor BamA n=1 Tax=Geobacter argillaceus TaxID=345631 RepID=A0A562VMQ7_9BACT|nr:outer membrane protein assembly factor BamA [Geobacter argillaceus]TWJ19273.1 Beta-barrel assembly machine subunit BamA [Geobacter argillaceus]
MLRSFKIIIVALLGVLLCGSVAFAETEQRIGQVVIKGNRRIESAAIANVLKVKDGDPFFPEKVDADVRAIYKLGHFQDVKAETSTGEKGLVLTYLVTEKPVVRVITIEGNKELSLEKVRDALDIKPNSIFSQKELAKGIRKVKKLYADEGYYLAEVQEKVEKRAENELNLRITVTEGDKILIRQIRFDGNRAFTAGKLKKAMETKEKWFLSWLTGAGTYKEEVLKNDAAAIADLYFNNGYVNVKVGEPKIELLPDKSGLTVTIAITEGDQFRTGTINFKGDLLESHDALAKLVKLKSGELFSRATLRMDIFTLTDLYADKGYAFANVNPLTRLNPEQKNIDLTFDFEKGEKVYIDRINISGNTKTRDKVIRRELKLAEGDLYGSTAIKKSKQNLMNLGFFEEANLATAKGGSDNKLNLNVEVKEKPTGTFSIGGGYSSLDGLIGQGSIQQANFLGLGLKMNASASIGGKSQTYNLGLTDPYFMDSRWTVGGDIYRTERQYIDYTRRATGGDIKAGYPLSDTVSSFFVYKYEGKQIYNQSQSLLDSIRNGLITAPETTSTTSAISASLNRNSTDYRLDPTRGMTNSLSVEFAGLGGTTRYLRYLGQSSYYIPAFWSAVFSAHATLGHIQALGKEVPIDEKFYLGGISTVRGYGGRTISPFRTNTVVGTDVDGIKSVSIARAYIGGDTEAIGNLELVFPILKEAGLKGVLFFDAGNAYEKASDIFSSMRTSYGFGVRWFSPIGPLRLEYGIPLNPRKDIDSSGGKLEFSIGGFF